MARRAVAPKGAKSGQASATWEKVVSVYTTYGDPRVRNSPLTWTTTSAPPTASICRRALRDWIQKVTGCFERRCIHRRRDGAHAAAATSPF